MATEPVCPRSDGERPLGQSDQRWSQLWVQYIEPEYHVRSSAELASAITALGANAGEICVRAPFTLGATQSIAATCNFSQRPGAVITIGAYDLNINGRYSAGPHQTFNVNSTGRPIFAWKAASEILADWFGVVADGTSTSSGTDNAAAFLAMFNSVGGTTGDRVFRINPGGYKHDDIGIISQNPTSAGSLTAYINGNVKIYAEGARMYHSGTGHGLTLQGHSPASTAAPKTMKIVGGGWVGNSTSNSVIRCRDGCGFWISPEFVLGETDTPILLLFQNWLQWSENISLTGYPLFLRGGLVQIELQGIAYAEAYEGADSGSANATESFARFRAWNIMTGQAQTHVLNVQGNAYDSFFTQFGGNCITVPAALINQGTTNSSMRRSHITDWKLEGRDDLTDDEPPEPHPTVNAKIFVSSVTDKSKLPKIRNVSWTYSLNGDEYPDVSTNSYIGDFTNDTWVTILSKEYIKYNAHMIVTATIGDNSVVGHVLVTKKPSAATVNVRDIGTQVACSFRDSSGDLQMKQTTGSDKTDIRITMIDYGGDHADG